METSFMRYVFSTLMVFAMISMLMAFMGFHDKICFIVGTLAGIGSFVTEYLFRFFPVA